MITAVYRFVTVVDSLSSYEYCVGHSSLSGYICYTGRFRTWFYSHLQAISYPYTDRSVLVSFHADNWYRAWHTLNLCYTTLTTRPKDGSIMNYAFIVL
jgi:hypothetical protein